MNFTYRPTAHKMDSPEETTHSQGWLGPNASHVVASLPDKVFQLPNPVIPSMNGDRHPPRSYYALPGKPQDFSRGRVISSDERYNSLMRPTRSQSGTPGNAFTHFGSQSYDTKVRSSHPGCHSSYPGSLVGFTEQPQSTPASNTGHPGIPNGHSDLFNRESVRLSGHSDGPKSSFVHPGSSNDHPGNQNGYAKSSDGHFLDFLMNGDVTFEQYSPELLRAMFFDADKSHRSEIKSQSQASDSEDSSLKSPQQHTDDESVAGNLLLYGGPATDQDLYQKVSLLRAELKFVGDERDSLNLNNNPPNLNMASHDKVVEKLIGRDMATLKDKCDRAIKEVDSLKHQLMEATAKREQVHREADMFKQKYKLMKDQVGQMTNELLGLKGKYKEVMAEKQKLEADVSDLQHLRQEDLQEMEELRKQQREVISESGSSEVLNKVYTTAVDKYESTKKDYDDLRRKYADLLGSHTTLKTQLEHLQEEDENLRKQLEDVIQERNEALKQKKALQQQCTSAIMKWNTATKEKGDLETELKLMRKDRDDYKENFNQVMTEKGKLNKDLVRVRRERDAALHEHHLIMSERDQVHKEMEQLHDKWQDASKKLEGSEKEKKKLQSEMEGLHEEITAALRDRDRAMKQVHEMKDRHMDYDKDRENDPLLDQNSLGHQREGSDRLSSSFDAVSKEGEAKDLANKEKEAEFLRREVERLQAELSDAVQEAEVSKRRRDWAFGERDKIVMERESIRTWCDKLRRERDRAVSDLAEALRDLDEFKKQKNEALKDLKEFKEKYNSLVEKEARKNQLHAVGHTHSRDSAIDADLQEWETETVELEISNVQPGEYGFDLVSGKEEGQLSTEGSVFVGSVSENCSAYGKLRKHDQVLRVNNIDMTNCDKKSAMQAVKSGGRTVNMLVRRRKSSTSRSIQPVHISLLGNRELGISLEHGLYISRILPGSAAAREGSLAVGDRIIHVNGHSVENLSINEVMQLVDEEGDFVVFNVLKYTCTPQPSLISSSSSGQMLLQESSPDMLSISPQSGRSQSWHTTPSPDPKLDLLHMQTSTDSHTDESPSMTSSTGSQNDPKAAALMDRVGASKVFSARQHEPKTRMANKSSYLSPSSPTSPMSTSSTTPASPSPASPSPSPQDEEDEMIRELKDIYKSYSKSSKGKSGLSSKKDKLGLKSDKSKENGGTWPKCHGPPVFGPHGALPTVIHAGAKDRPQLSGLFNSDHADYKHYSNQADSRVPPTPPERSDSFKKGASIKDAPQNSDSAKYPYRVGGVGVNVGVKTVTPGYLTSLSRSQTDAKSSSMDKSAVFDKSNSLPGSCYYPQVSTNSCPPSSSSSPASSYMSEMSPPFSPDHTVVSAKADQKDFRSYLHSRRHQHNRPTSAPSSRGRHDKHQRPQKLDIQPFSPRPLPHSGHTIMPFSQPVSPRDSISSTSSSCGVNPQSPTSTPASPTHNSMAAVGRLQRTGNPPVQVVSSQRVTHGSGVSPGMSLSLGGHGSFSGEPPSPAATSPHHFHHHHHHQPPHPMYSSVPSPHGFHGYSNGGPPPPPPHHYPDLPGLNRGGVAINYMRYTPSPSPSLQSGTFDTSMGNSVGNSVEDFNNQRRSAMQDGMTFSNRSVGIPSNSSIYSGSFEGGLPADFPRTSQSLPKNVPSSNVHPRPRPQAGETRSIHIEKSQEPLGIKIDPGPGGGIFVSSVGKQGLAYQAGLEVGDQLLEVCGINMRNATYKEAATVMRQCGDNITMLVQYNPEKYNENDCESSSDTDEESSANNTPQTSRSTQIQHHHAPSDVSTITPDSPQSRSPVHSGKMGPSQCTEEGPMEPRFVFLKKTHSHDSLGITVIGGNATGIFVSEVQPGSIAAGPQGLCCGDQILEFNGTNFRSATAEQAAFEISKPVETVTILAQYNLAKYTKAQEHNGDGFYTRMLYDREVEADGELRFHKEDILWIDNTRYNNMLGVWRAWLVDEEGNKLRCGTIPSKARLEEEIAQRRSISDLHEDELKGSRRGSGSARRSFFRRKKHQRSSSKDSRELTSYSDVSINSDSVPYLDVDGSLMTFQRVERLECHSCRPVVLLGPLAEPLINKLTSESPDKYCRCDPELLSVAEMENNADVGWCVDFRRRDDHYECITVSTVKSIMEKNRHCMLNVSPSAIEILHKVDIYPIVLFIKHKSAKQIREVRDTRFLPEKMTNKSAKELFETFQKYETDHKHLFSDIVQGGNLAFMCFKLKAAIDKEQRKVLWIPTESTC